MTVLSVGVMAGSGVALPELFSVDPLIVEASDGKLIISSPFATKRLRVQPRVVELLLGARTGLRRDERPDADQAEIQQLVEHGFLVEEAKPIPSPWLEWGAAAWNFHSRIRDTPFLTSAPQSNDEYVSTITARRRPPNTRTTGSERILLLPRVRTRCAASYLDVLESRRTHRHFDSRAVDLDRFSDMLHYSFAPLRFADAGLIGAMQLRSAASGGARHECEAFVFVFNVTNVDAGLYAYDGIRHGLVPLQADVTREHAEHLIHNQGFFTSASFGVLTAAVADRMSWKYLHPRAYRILLQDVGHVAQVFSMTATALGLGASLTGAIRDTEADQLLGLDIPREFTTFAMACGYPIAHDDGLPVSIRTVRSAPDEY